jgi:hypothetical protein
VSGTTEYNNVTNLAIQDPIIALGRGANNTPLASATTTDRGEQLYYYNTAERSAFIGYISGSNPNSAIQNKLIAATQATVTNEVVTVASFGTVVVGAVEGASVSVTGNVTAGNVLGGANVNATTHTGTTVSVTGNITGGNIITGGLVNATNHTGTTVSVTGNVTATQFIGSGAGLTSIPGGNVSGTVANAVYATTAGSATSATTAGSATSATTAGTVTNSAQGNITSLGSLTSLIIPTGTSDPGGAVQGQFYYNTINLVLRIYLGSGWRNC